VLRPLPSCTLLLIFNGSRSELIGALLRRRESIIGEASQLIEEPACVIDREPPFSVRNPHRLLTLQPSATVKVGLRHAVRRDTFAFPTSASSGSGGRLSDRVLVSEVVRRRSISPSSSALRQGTFASASCRSTSALDVAATSKIGLGPKPIWGMLDDIYRKINAAERFTGRFRRRRMEVLRAGAKLAGQIEAFVADLQKIHAAL
jgi:hypothetical protein